MDYFTTVTWHRPRREPTDCGTALAGKTASVQLTAGLAAGALERASF
jgi:hypothetical protein